MYNIYLFLNFFLISNKLWCLTSFFFNLISIVSIFIIFSLKVSMGKEELLENERQGQGKLRRLLGGTVKRAHVALWGWGLHWSRG